MSLIGVQVGEVPVQTVHGQEAKQRLLSKNPPFSDEKELKLSDGTKQGALCQYTEWMNELR